MGEREDSNRVLLLEYKWENGVWGNVGRGCSSTPLQVPGLLPSTMCSWGGTKDHKVEEETGQLDPVSPTCPHSHLHTVRFWGGSGEK